MRLLLIVLMAVALASASSHVEASIEGPFLWSGNGHYYSLVIDDASSDPTWDQAKAAAESMSMGVVNGHLATITSAAENQFITNAFAATGLAKAWIGAFQPPGSVEPDGGWQWVTGETWDYTNWDGGEPNEHLGQNEGVVQFTGAINADGATWNDQTADHIHQSGGYIVEFDIPEPTAFVVWSLLGLTVAGGAWWRRRR